MGGVLTNFILFLTEQRLCQKILLSLQTTWLFAFRICGRVFVADFAVASSVGKQKVETRGARQKKENRIQKFEVESRR